VLLGGWLFMLGCLAFIWFAAVLRARLAEAEGTDRGHDDDDRLRRRGRGRDLRDARPGSRHCRGDQQERDQRRDRGDAPPLDGRASSSAPSWRPAALRWAPAVLAFRTKVAAEVVGGRDGDRRRSCS
jgi:hypothetical protein